MTSRDGICGVMARLSLVVCLLLSASPREARSQSSDLPYILNAHNRHRFEHGAPPLYWDNNLQIRAQDWAELLATTCGGLTHTTEDTGENLYMCQTQSSGCARGENSAVAVDDPIAGWYESEKAYPLTQTSHLTQLLWSSTTLVGCGVSSCMLGTFVADIVVCRYDPPGNVVGEFEANVFPAAS